ncbi:PA2169 family four-helix-bundle protein [Botrimarina mediterranea]|uniref:PA2169 family four-helix-bundle protein n=1 Tax=Botrimarina mediterranea TaxID=2528022 RepID=UPI003AF31A09
MRELRRLCVDSSKGFEECAELTDSAGLKSLFIAIADERRGLDAELERQIEWNEGHEEEDGSYLAAMHRAWIKVRDAMSGKHDDAYILSEAERGEDAIKEAYEDALKETTGSPIHSLLADQYLQVKDAHDRVRDLRDAAKA